MIQTRRSFLGVLTLSILNGKNAFSKTKSDQFSEFQKLFGLKTISTHALDSTSFGILTNDLNTKWLGFELIDNKCFSIENKLFVPVNLKSGERVIDNALICYEFVNGVLKNIPSLTSFHISGIIQHCQNLPVEVLRKAILPKYSIEYVPYGYITETGRLILKTTCSYETNISHLIIDSELLNPVEHKFQTSNQG